MHRNIKKYWLAWSLAALLIAALACGPAAPTGQDATPAPTPTPDPAVRATLEAVVADPTAQTGLPTPTPRPTAPATPTPTPFPTLETPPDNTERIAALFSPHPDGLEGCRNISNAFVATAEEYQYVPWCTEELSSYIASACNELSTSEEEIACAKQDLSNAKSIYV